MASALVKFFAFNATISKKESTEEQNILFYWPEDTNIDRQTNDVGLARGLTGFTATFSPVPIELMQTEKNQQVFHECEPEFWFSMVVSRPNRDTATRAAEVRELDHHILLSILQKTARMCSLMVGSFQRVLSEEGPEAIRAAFHRFFDVYIPSHLIPTFTTADIFDTLDGIQFLPVDRLSFLRMQSFVNKVETRFEDRVLAATVLLDDFLLYSGVNQRDSRSMFSFLTKRRPRTGAHGDNVAWLAHAPIGDGNGFLTTLPTGGAGAAETSPSGGGLRLWIGDPPQPVGLVVWQHTKAVFAFYVTEEAAGDLTFHRQLEAFIESEIEGTIPSILSNVTRSQNVDETCHYIYFNHMNMALKSSLRKPGTLVGSHQTSLKSTEVSDLMTYVEAIHADFASSADLKEIIMKTNKNEGWVAGRKSGNREFYALFHSKNSLPDVNDEVKRISQMFFNGIFVD